MKKNLNIDHLIESIAAFAPIKNLESLCEGLNLDETGKYGRTPLMVAAAEGFSDAVDMLITKGASVKALGTKKISALHEASANGATEVVDHLIKSGAEVDAVSEDGVTPLMCAAAWGCRDVAELLLNNGADKFLTDHLGVTAADIAREKGEDKTAEFIDGYKSLPLKGK